MILNLTIMKTFHIWSQTTSLVSPRDLHEYEHANSHVFFFHNWTFIIWFNWTKLWKWFNSNFNENPPLVNPKDKNIVLSSIQFNYIWILIQLGCIQFKVHYANSFNIFIQMELNFHKINLLFHHFIITNSAEPKLNSQNQQQKSAFFYGLYVVFPLHHIKCSITSPKTKKHLQVKSKTNKVF
jgi:hypothetical protein